jgi:hypothetical protein
MSHTECTAGDEKDLEASQTKHKAVVYCSNSFLISKAKKVKLSL